MPASGGVGCLLKALAGFFACLFVLSTPVVLVLADVDQKLLQPGTYKQVLVEQDVYRRLPGLIAEQIELGGSMDATDRAGGSGSTSGRDFIARIFTSASPALGSCLQDGLGDSAYEDLRLASRVATSPELDRVKACLKIYGVPSSAADTEAGMPIFFWVLSADDWHTVLTPLLPPEWLQTQAESVIDQAFAAAESDEEHPVIRIPLADLKARLAGEEGYAAVVQLISDQPPCTLDQLTQVSGLAAAGELLKNIPICSPPPWALNVMAPSIRATLDSLVAQIPDVAEVKLTDDSNSPSTDQLGPVRQVLGATRFLIHIAMFLPSVLLVLVALFGARSLASLLRSLGGLLIATGVLSGVLAIAGLAGASAINWKGLFAGGSGGSDLAPGVVQLVGDIAAAITRSFLITFGLVALLMTLAGLLMAVAAYFVSLNKPEQVRAPYPPAETGS